MNYRKASSDEHITICKQVRSQSVLAVCLMAPVIPFVVLALCLSINMMVRQNYDKAAFIGSTVLLVVFAVVVAVFMISLMSGFVKRISCINKRNYSVADCVVTGRFQTINPKHNHSFVTVSFPDENTQQAMVSPKVYALAENGKRALLIKYNEPEGKLPFEIAVLNMGSLGNEPHLQFITEETEQNGIAVLLKLVDGDSILDTFPIEYPECGFGGCDLIDNPDHSMVVLALYSGQSDYAFKVFKASEGKLVLLLEEDYSYGEATYMWSGDGKKLFQIVDTCLYMEVSDFEQHCVGTLNVFDVFETRKETKEITYDFAGFDPDELDFFRMTFSVIDGNPCVVMPNNVIMNIE